MCDCNRGRSLSGAPRTGAPGHYVLVVERNGRRWRVRPDLARWIAQNDPSARVVGRTLGNGSVSLSEPEVIYLNGVDWGAVGRWFGRAARDVGQFVVDNHEAVIEAARGGGGAGTPGVNPNAGGGHPGFEFNPQGAGGGGNDPGVIYIEREQEESAPSAPGLDTNTLLLAGGAAIALIVALKK